MRRRTRLTLVLAAAAALLAGPAAGATPDACAEAPRSDFVDRDEAREPHRPSIDCVDHTNIAQGRTENEQRFYAPLESVTRGQMASFIIQTLQAAGYADELPSGEATEEDPDEFNDIAASVHRERINQLARIGVANGVGDGTNYAPEARITRQQMASFILATAEFALAQDYQAEASHFSDVKTRNIHYGTINAGFEQGLFSGTTPPQPGVENSGTFSPGRTVLRDQMASFLTNLLDRTEQ